MKSKDFLMDPCIDFAFKEIMRNDDARNGFLSAILNLNLADIRETMLLNTNLVKQHEYEKQGILDVRILLNNNTQINIEIQLAPFSTWADRSLFYLSKLYTEQIKPGENYTVFKKCVSISILDFTLFKDTKEFYSRFHILEDTRHTLYTDKMEFHVLELPKLPKELKEDASDILLWAKFINSKTKEEFEMLAEKNNSIAQAYRQLQIISQDEQKQLEYDARQKAIWDHNQLMLEAEQRGEKRGEKRGIERGIQQGIQVLILDNLEYGISKEIILQKLQKRFDLTQEQAEMYFQKFNQ